MRVIWKKTIAAVLAAAMVVNMSGCGSKHKKTPKPEPKTTTVVDNGNTDATGSGDGQSDTPLVIGCSKLSQNFNPFSVKTDDDKQAVDLTQAYLVINDRAGEIVYKGIDGEVKSYNGTDYTYYGTSDVNVRYNKKKDQTTYTITLRDDLLFSDGEAMTIDDVIFTMYAYCDNDYSGDMTLGQQSIKGLLNYQSNSSMAEKISAKKVRKYINNKPAKLRKWIKAHKSQVNDDSYDKLLENEARRQIASAMKKSKKNKNVKNIAGIKKLGKYKMSVTTDGYDSDMIYALQIPISPLHYYGDTSKYNYKNNKFGFKRGDISSLRANKTSPVGAGAYRFVKYDKEVIYYTSNELYYNGCPKIAFVQLKEMKSTLRKDYKKIDKELANEKADSTASPTASADAEATPTPLPTGVTNRVAEATEVSEGTVDAIDTLLNQEDLRWVAQVNSNGKISGSTVVTRFTPSETYQYVGINAENVKVGAKRNSKQSVYLRKALATAISAYRSDLNDYYGYATNIIDYPYASSSWLAPQSDDDDYKQAFVQDIDGDDIYNSKTSDEDKATNVKEAVIAYLEAAGYTIADGKATKAPVGAELSYRIWVYKGQENPMYQVIKDASLLLKKVGIDLKIVAMSDENVLSKKLQSGSQQLWCGSCDTSQDSTLNSRYNSQSNIFGIADVSLNRLMERVETVVKDGKKQNIYSKCFDKIMNWAVEVPVYEEQMGTIYSSSRIDMDTMTNDVTPYYSWIDEIQNVQMKS